MVKAAEICLRLGAEPAAYVRAQRRANTAKDFYPTMLHTRSADQNWQNYLKVSGAPVVGAWYVQEIYLGQAVGAGRSEHSVLMDDHMDFDAWYRVLRPAVLDLEVQERYTEKAQDELKDPVVNRYVAGLAKEHGLDLTRLR